MTVRILILCCGVLLTPWAMRAQSPKKEIPSPKEESARRLAERIDAEFESYWKRNDNVPAPQADDAEFLRRVSLDMVGCIPTVREVRDFLADRGKDKRVKAIAQLQARSQHSVHLANVLRQQWLPQTLDNAQFANAGAEFEKHLRDQLRARVGYDKIVREILTASTESVDRRSPMRMDQAGEPAAAFNRVNEFNPANVAASASRLFMGVKLECCQCHNHPFNSYKREQFWELAAFFAEVNPTIAAGDQAARRSIAIPDMDKTISAKFLNGELPKYKDDSTSPRAVFADWLTAKENPYFARNAVNRVWQHFFGLGFIDPIDEPADDNPPLIPELQEFLAREFADSGYDLQLLMNAVARSKVYQRTSKMTHESQSNPRYFARANVRGLTGEQIRDSLAQATGMRDTSSGPNNPRLRNGIVSKFSSPEPAIERQTSILQALSLMNGKTLNGQIDLNTSDFLAGVVDAPFLSPAGKIESLFLTSISRMPTKEELKKYQEYIDRAKIPEEKKKAYADIFWALLNSSEFLLNH